MVRALLVSSGHHKMLPQSAKLSDFLLCSASVGQNGSKYFGHTVMLGLMYRRDFLAGRWAAKHWPIGRFICVNHQKMDKLS